MSNDETNSFSPLGLPSPFVPPWKQGHSKSRPGSDHGWVVERQVGSHQGPEEGSLLLKQELFTIRICSTREFWEWKIESSHSDSLMFNEEPTHKAYFRTRYYTGIIFPPWKSKGKCEHQNQNHFCFLLTFIKQYYFSPLFQCQKGINIQHTHAHIS